LRRLGNRVRELRTAKGWNQEDLAHECQVDRTYVSGIERGIRNISVVVLSKLAKALGTSPADLLR
jgi:transcriptional regulator with XRE-family HTH domain